MTRLLTAALLIPATWYLCKRAPFPLFLAAALLIAAVGAWEAAVILRRRGSRPFTLLVVTASVAIAAAFALDRPEGAALAALTGVALVVPLLAMHRESSPEQMLDTVLATLLPVVVVGLPFAFVVGLRAIPGTDGPDLLLFAMLCVTLSDTAAYYVGSAFGKHRMAPVISPKKSWEGAAGGLFGSLVAAMLAHYWFFQRLPIRHAILLAIILCGAGIVGDLAESMMKRAAGVKDSSALLPGHGGLLDRMDSLLVAAPVLYYYWNVFLAGAL